MKSYERLLARKASAEEGGEAWAAGTRRTTVTPPPWAASARKSTAVRLSPSPVGGNGSSPPVPLRPRRGGRKASPEAKQSLRPVQEAEGETHREEVTVQIDWEGSLGLEVGVNPQTGMVMITKVRETSAVRARAPSVERGAEIVAVNAHRLRPFPAHQGGAALGDHAQLRAYMVQTRSAEQGAITDAEVAAMWATIDVNGDGSVTMAEFLETMANAVLKDVLGLIGRTPRPHTITFGVDVPVACAKEEVELHAPASAPTSTSAPAGTDTDEAAVQHPEGVVGAAVTAATAAARATGTGSFEIAIAEGGALGLAFSIGSSCALTLIGVPKGSGRAAIENSGVSLETGDALLALNGELFPRFALGEDGAGRFCLTREELAHAIASIPLRAAFAAHQAKKKKGEGKKKKKRKASTKGTGKGKGKKKSGKLGATKTTDSGEKETGSATEGEPQEHKSAGDVAGKKKKRKGSRKGTKKCTRKAGSTGAVTAADTSDGAVDERTDDAIATLLLAHFAPRTDDGEGADASGDSNERWIDASMLAPFQQMVLDATLEKIGAAERPLTLTFTRTLSVDVVGAIERTQARLRGASLRRSVVARRARDVLCAAAAAATSVAAAAGEAAAGSAAAAAANIRARLDADAAQEEAQALAAALARVVDAAVTSATAAVGAADAATMSATSRCTAAAAAAVAAAPAPATAGAPTSAEVHRAANGSAATIGAPPALALQLRAGSLQPPSFPYDGSDEEGPTGVLPRLSTAEQALVRAASQAVLIPAAQQQPALARIASGAGAAHPIPPALGSDADEQHFSVRSPAAHAEALPVPSPPLAAATATAASDVDGGAVPAEALPLEMEPRASPIAAASCTDALLPVAEPQRTTAPSRSSPGAPAPAQTEASRDVLAMLRAAEEQSAALKAELYLRAGELAATRKQLDAAEAAAAAVRNGNTERGADAGAQSPGETFLKQRQDDMIAVLAVILERQSKTAADDVQLQRDARDGAWRSAAIVIQCAARCHLATRAFYRQYESALAVQLSRPHEEQQRRQPVHRPLKLPAPSPGSQADRAHRAAWSATTAVAHAQTAARAAAYSRRVTSEVAQLRAQLEEQKRDIAARDALLLDRIGTAARESQEERARTPSCAPSATAQRYRSPFLSAERRRDSPKGAVDATTRSHSPAGRGSSPQVLRAAARPPQYDGAPPHRAGHAPSAQQATFDVVAAFKRSHAELTARDALLMDAWQRELLSIGAASIAARQPESLNAGAGAHASAAPSESRSGGVSVGESPRMRRAHHVSPRRSCRRIAESETWGKWLRAFELIERRAALRIVW